MSVLLELRNKIASKRYELIGEGKDGHVYHYDKDKVIKLSKSKTFIDSEVLTDLNGLSTFPKLYKCSSKWYIAEKFEGISIIDTPLKEDWEDILAKDIDLHVNNLIAFGLVNEGTDKNKLKKFILDSSKESKWGDGIESKELGLYGVVVIGFVEIGRIVK